MEILLLVLANAISAATFPLGKFSIGYAHPIFLTGIRMVVAGILLVAFEALRGNAKITITKKFIFLMAGLAFLNVFFTNCLQFWALNYVGAGKATFIFNTSPFFAAVASYYLYHERMTFKKIAGLVIAFLGFLPVLLATSQVSQNSLPYGIAEIALIIGAIGSVAGWMFMKELLQKTDCSFVMANGISMLLGGVLFFPVSYLSEGADWNVITNVGMVSLLLAGLIFVNNIVSYNAYAYFLKKVPATLIFLISFTAPLFAMVYGWLFLGEQIGIPFFITIFIVGVGLYLYYTEEIRLQREAALHS